MQTLGSEGEAALEIAQVRVVLLDLRNLSEELVYANLRARAGMKATEALIDQDIRSLYRTGLFDTIEVKRERSGGKVVLIYEVRPKYRVGAVNFEGNKRFASRRLAEEAKTVVNSSLEERQVKEDASKIFELYQKAGYSNVVVTYRLERNPGTGRGIVTFNISEGPRTRIRRIEFTGNTHVKARKLRKQMEETRKWHIFSWVTGKGRFKDGKFDDDLDKVRDYYREQGYLDVQIDRTKVEFNYPKKGRMVIRIPVVEGAKYQMGDISFSGNKLYPTVLLKALLSVRPGQTFVPTKVDKDVEAVRDFYGRFGYLETEVRLRRQPNLKTGRIDVVYDIEESGRYSVETFRIDGNTKTRTTAIIREIALSPGDTFDLVRMKISEQRLKNTRFFGDMQAKDDGVEMNPESVNLPDRKNLRVNVREGRTGNFSFGAGFSSLEKVVFFAELTQGNFDAFAWRSAFQGNGQKFRLRVQAGNRTTDIILSFEEPWLFERAIAAGFSFYRSSVKAELNNGQYGEVRTGFDVYARKRLFELFEGRIGYSLQTVELTDLSENSRRYISYDQYTISKMTFGLGRDTRDELITTTRGNRLMLSADLAGRFFGGTEDIYRLEMQASQFFPISKWQKQVLAFNLRLGVIQAFGGNKKRWPILLPDPDRYGNPYFPDGTPRQRNLGYLQMPISERYFLGGPNTLRGFEYREITPVIQDGYFGLNGAGGVSYIPFRAEIGGKTMGLFNMEYSIDVVDPIRFAIFYDGGFVNVDGWDFGLSEYNDNWGVGIRLFMMGTPLRIDYGMPIHSSGDKGRTGQFNFSYGASF